MNTKPGLDSDSIASLYLTHRDLVWRYLRRRTGCPQAADDLLGAVFLAAVRRLPHFESRGIPVLHWLYRVATRAARRWRHAQTRTPLRAEHVRNLVSTASPTDREETIMAAAAELDASDGARSHDQVIALALAELPEPQRIVVLLHYFQALTQREIAVLLELCEGTVRSRLSRGLGRLRVELGAHRAA